MKINLLKAKLFLLFKTLISFSAQAQSPATGLTFDGNNDYVDLRNIAGANFESGNFTIELWIKTGVNPTLAMPLISKRFDCNHDNFWNLNINSGGTLYFEADNSFTNYFNMQSTTYITDNNWHHIAVQHNCGAITLFIDGNIDKSENHGVTYLNNSYSVHLGKSACSDQPWARYYEGSMDEVRIWNYARNQQEIIDMMSCELSGNEVDLVSYYNFNQGVVGGNNSGENVLLDQSNGANNGSLINFLLNGFTSNWSEGVSITTCYPSMPVSNWAIGIALFMMLSFVVIRSSKLF